MLYLFALQVPSPIGILWERKLTLGEAKEFLGHMDEQVPGWNLIRIFQGL